MTLLANLRCKSLHLILELPDAMISNLRQGKANKLRQCQSSMLHQIMQDLCMDLIAPVHPARLVRAAT